MAQNTEIIVSMQPQCTSMYMDPINKCVSQTYSQNDRRELQLAHEALLWNGLKLASYLLPFHWTNELSY